MRNYMRANLKPNASAPPAGLVATILATQPGALAAYYQCGETSGTTLADSSGNSKDLALVGTPTTDYTLNQAGQVGASVRFHGAAGYAWRDDCVLGAEIEGLDFTLFCLVAGPTGQNALRAMALGNSSSGTPIVTVATVTTGAAAGFARGNSSLPNTNLGGGVAFDDVWHSLAFRRAGTNYSFWVDGVSVNSSTATISTTLLNRTSIGALVRSSPSNFIEASMQHAALWTNDLTDQELEDLHAAAFT